MDDSLHYIILVLLCVVLSGQSRGSYLCLMWAGVGGLWTICWLWAEFGV